MPRRNIKLGFDNFAVRAMKWNAVQLIDYAAKLRTDSLFITDFGPFGKNFGDAHLGDLRERAADKGIQIVLGSWSICPTSKSFKADWGKAYVRGGPKQYNGGTIDNLYQNGAVRNIAAFHQHVTGGNFTNDTVQRAVDGCLACILGREAAARHGLLTMEELLRENRRLELNLEGLKA